MVERDFREKKREGPHSVKREIEGNDEGEKEVDNKMGIKKGLTNLGRIRRVKKWKISKGSGKERERKEKDG